MDKALPREEIGIGDSNRPKRPDNRCLIFGSYPVVNRPWQSLSLEGQLPDLTNSQLDPKRTIVLQLLNPRKVEQFMPFCLLPWVTYLALPVSVHPLLILLPSAVLLGAAVDIAAGTFKKYL